MSWNWLIERAGFLWQVGGFGWLLILVAWSVFSNAATVRDNFLSPERRERWETLRVIPKLSWQAWIIGLLVISLLAVMEGAFRVWRDERQRREAQKAESEKAIADLENQLKRNVPHLEGRILLTASGSFSRGTPERVPLIFLLMSIHNTGAETAVEGWPLDVNIDGKNITVQPVIFTQTVQLPATKSLPATVIRPEDTIYEKTSIPIKTGGVMRGWLIYTLDGVDPFKLAAGTKLTVRFGDVFGNESKATTELAESLSGQWYYPGTGMSLPSPKKPLVKAEPEPEP